LPDSFNSTTACPEVPRIAEPQPSFLSTGLDLRDRPAFPGGYHAHLCAAAEQRVRPDLVFAWHCGNSVSGFTLSKVVVTRKVLASRAVFEGDE
jgi:hypothetical protein